jgi:hypothetical protein
MWAISLRDAGVDRELSLRRLRRRRIIAGEYD